MRMGIESVDYTYADNDCIQSSFGTTDTRTVVIDLSVGAVPATHYPDGYLPKGTVLARRTSDKVFVLYDDGSGTAGIAVADCVLVEPCRVGNPGTTYVGKVSGAGLWHGVLKPLAAPFQTGVGALDANAQADMAGRFRYILGS